MLRFQLDQATSQFTETYERLSCQSSDAEVKAAYDNMYALQMGSTRTAVQLQSLQSNTSDAFNRLCALLSGSFLAKGNLDSQQIAAQQQALAIQLAQQQAARQAAAERIKAMQEAQ